MWLEYSLSFTSSSFILEATAIKPYAAFIAYLSITNHLQIFCLTTETAMDKKIYAQSNADSEYVQSVYK